MAQQAGRIGVALAGAIVLVLVLAQVFLPGIAASRISSRVGRYGTVQSVSVQRVAGRGAAVGERRIGAREGKEPHAEPRAGG